MARIPLTEGFSVIPEGTYVFKVTEVKYDDAFGKMTVSLVTETGRKHAENFRLKNENGWNENALNAFSLFAKNCLNDFTRNEIDEKELVGTYIRCNIVHTKVESTRKPGTFNTFANLGYEKEPATGFDNAVAEEPKKNFDLGSLLG